MMPIQSIDGVGVTPPVTWTRARVARGLSLGMRFLPLAVLWLLAPACASVPSRFSARSAAAPEATAAPIADVTVALRGDPPLPDADATGWPGLGGDVPTMDHAHMGHGGGMPMDHGGTGGGSTMDHSPMGEPPPAPSEEEAEEAEHTGGHHHAH